MSAHLDLDGLSDLLAGEGEPAQLGHLAGCPACSAALAELEQAQEPVRAALAALAPPEVPPDLVARLDAALLRARESDLTPGRLRAVPTGPTGKATAGSTRIDAMAVARPATRGGSWLLGSAAAVVVVAAVAGVAVGMARMAGSSSTSSSAGSALVAPRAASEPAGGQVAASSSGTDYAADPGALAAAMPALLRGGATSTVPSTATTAAGSGSRTGPLARLHDPAALADCLAGLTSGSGPVALDYARYAGAPALVVILPAARPDRVDVFVVGADCHDGAEHTLLSTELARGS